MKWAFKIGTLFGIPIKVHFTFFLLLIFIGLSRGPYGGANGVILVCLIFFTVVLHELGHSLVAKKYGFKVRDITLLPIGGIAGMEEIPEDPHQELNIAIIGPTVSFVLSFLFFAAGWILKQWAELYYFWFWSRGLLMNLAWINLVLAVFNLLPAFPMDGGRVFRGILARFNVDYITATRIAVNVGQFFALLMIFFGIFFNFWLVLIGIFIYIGAEGEGKTTELRVCLKSVTVEKIMLKDFKILSPEQTLGDVLELVHHGMQGDFPVLENNNLVGILSQSAILAALHKYSRDVQVKEVMERNFITTTSDTPLTEIYKKMINTKATVMPVVRNNVLEGLITLEQIGRYHLFCGDTVR